MLTYYPKPVIPEGYKARKFVVLRGCGHQEEIRTHAPYYLGEDERKYFDNESIAKAESKHTKCEKCKEDNNPVE